METTLERRLAKESKLIFEKYKNITIEYNNENSKYILHLSTIIKGKKLTFLNSPNYPFSPPALNINGKDYIHLLSFSFPDLHDYLEKNNSSCLCCSTLLCSNNWKPAIKLMNVMNEYEEIREIIVKCLYKKYTRIVCNHYNIFAEELVENIIKYIN